MNPKSPAQPPKRPAASPPESPASGKFPRERPSEAQLLEKKSGYHGTPEGFPGPTTVLLMTARSDSGRAPQQILELMRMLKSTGIRIFVASPVNPPYGYEIKKLADKFIPIPHREFSFSAMLRVRQSIRKHKIGIIHSHGRTAGVYSRLLGFLTGVSVIHTYHGIQSESGFKGQFKLLVDKILAGFDFDAIFSSEAERQKALQKGVAKDDRETFVIENAVDLERFPKRKHGQTPMGQIDRAKPESFTSVRIGALLRPESTRGHEHFLRIVQECAGQANFTCAGMTREKLAKIGTIPANLEIVGPLADPTSWLYSLDMFVSTSTGDGQVVGSLEAMAAGAICVLSNVSAHQAFEKHHAAILFDPKSVQGFQKVLSDLLNDKAVRDMVLGNSRYMLERFHDGHTFKAKILELYRGAAKRLFRVGS